MPQLQVMIEGVFDYRRFLDLVRLFIVFEDAEDWKLTKKMAGYHQFHTVNVAVEETLRAADRARLHEGPAPGAYASRAQKDAKPGDRRVGVVWHTQGWAGA